MFKKFFLVALLLSHCALAQQTASINNFGKISGKIVDETNGEPLPFAAVTVWTKTGADSSLTGGTQTDEAGKFTINNLPLAALIVRTSFVGYLSVNQQIALVGDSAKWEFGLRSFTYARDQQYLFKLLKEAGQEYTLLQDYSQNALITESVNAAYTLYTSQLLSGISIQAGLRLEQSFLHGQSRFDGSTFGYNYPSKTGQNLFQSFFPSFSATKELSKTSELALSLSWKVGRPNFRHVFVGIQANDRQNITIGNPAVRPEFVNTA